MAQSCSLSVYLTLVAETPDTKQAHMLIGQKRVYYYEWSGYLFEQRLTNQAGQWCIFGGCKQLQINDKNGGQKAALREFREQTGVDIEKYFQKCKKIFRCFCVYRDLKNGYQLYCVKIQTLSMLQDIYKIIKSNLRPWRDPSTKEPDMIHCKCKNIKPQDWKIKKVEIVTIENGMKSMLGKRIGLNYNGPKENKNIELDQAMLNYHQDWYKNSMLPIPIEQQIDMYQNMAQVLYNTYYNNKNENKNTKVNDIAPKKSNTGYVMSSAETAKTLSGNTSGCGGKSKNNRKGKRKGKDTSKHKSTNKKSKMKNSSKSNGVNVNQVLDSTSAKPHGYPSFIRLFVLRRILGECIDNINDDTMSKLIESTDCYKMIKRKMETKMKQLFDKGICKYMKRYYDCDKDSQEAEIVELIYDKIIFPKFGQEYENITGYKRLNNNNDDDDNFQSQVFNVNDIMCLILSFLDIHSLISTSKVSSHLLYHSFDINSIWEADLTELIVKSCFWDIIDFNFKKNYWKKMCTTTMAKIYKY